MTQFNVLWWNFNDDHPTPLDVLPYFRRCYDSCRKKDRPVTKEQWMEFVRQNGMYMFWSKCEYEIIVSQWPPTDKSSKVDVWQQIEPNLDLIVKLLMEEYTKFDVHKPEYEQFLKSIKKKVTVEEFLDKYSKYLNNETD